VGADEVVTGYQPDAWNSFFLANAGAAAALAGLVFVGVSINVATIVKSQRLTGRALEAFTLLASTLIVSVLVLVPRITTTGLGIALAVVGLVVWLTVSAQHARTLPTFGGEPDDAAPRGSTTARILLGQMATLPVLVAAGSLMAESGGGIYWLVGAIVIAYTAALINAWVLLIEILR
jgi:hypothetical protein